MPFVGASPSVGTSTFVDASPSVGKAESSGAAPSADAPAVAGKPNPAGFADAARADAAESREPAEGAAAEARENAGSDEASAREGSVFPMWKADCLTASFALLSSEAPPGRCLGAKEAMSIGGRDPPASSEETEGNGNPAFDRAVESMSRESFSGRPANGELPDRAEAAAEAFWPEPAAAGRPSGREAATVRPRLT